VNRLFSRIVFISAVLVAVFGVLCSLPNAGMLQFSYAFASLEISQGWEVLDIVTPTLDSVEWLEQGFDSELPSWISDGRWFEAHSRQILVKSGNYIFATFSESFNWTAVNASLGKEGFIYSSFDDFGSHLHDDPNWWLVYSWGISGDWLGISSNKTRVVTGYDANTSVTFVEISCQITNIPGYFVDVASSPREIGIAGEKLPKPLFAGFDLTAIYLGDLEILQLSEDYGPNYRNYKIHFKAPASLLYRTKETYSLSLGISPQCIGQIHNVHRSINISMPSDSEVRSTSPSDISACCDNIAMFSLSEGDTYPQSIDVTSGSPEKSLTEILFENIGRWATEPEIWVALGTAIAAFYAIFHGQKMWSRQKTYYRLYKSMVNLYDHYSSDLQKFSREIENLSKSVSKYFVEGKINDDQFDKLLTRRDDLIERAKTQPSKD
jgi:hypothetical protein